MRAKNSAEYCKSNHSAICTVSFCLTGTKVRVIEDQDERKTLLQSAHEGCSDSFVANTLGEHIGQDKTETKLTECYWWPNLRDDVRKFVNNCERCQKRGGRFQKPAADSLHSIAVPLHPWKEIGVDICEMPESSEGFTCMVVATDYFTNWIEAEPLLSESAQSVAQFLYNLFCRHGCADVQIHDHGQEFVNEVASSLHTLTGVEHKLTSAYHSQSNGLVEQSNWTVQNLLLKVLNDSSDEGERNWPRALPRVLFSLRTSKLSSMAYTPFYLLYGRHPKCPVSFVANCGSKYASREPRSGSRESKPESSKRFWSESRESEPETSESKESEPEIRESAPESSKRFRHESADSEPETTESKESKPASIV